MWDEGLLRRCIRHLQKAMNHEAIDLRSVVVVMKWIFTNTTNRNQELVYTVQYCTSSMKIQWWQGWGLSCLCLNHKYIYHPDSCQYLFNSQACCKMQDLYPCHNKSACHPSHPDTRRLVCRKFVVTFLRSMQL